VRIQSCYFREKPQAGNSRITESCFFFVTERVMGGVEIVFLDVETTIPYKKGQKFEILEFGAIVLCAQGLVEKTSFCTYVQPSSMAAISKKSVDCNGITKNDAAHAPFFSQIADHVYNLLDGRVWAGHNILSFDIPRIQEAFAEAGLQAPTAAGVIDTLPLLKSTFGCRAGNMKVTSCR
jgi:DNA polymerase III epsilon subunit-like protein